MFENYHFNPTYLTKEGEKIVVPDFEQFLVNMYLDLNSRLGNKDINSAYLMGEFAIMDTVIDCYFPNLWRDIDIMSESYFYDYIGGIDK